MEIEDATADERFAGNPLVVTDPGIRFYAGAPLVTPTGHSVGILCVIDRTPRRLSGAQRAALRALSRQVMEQLELRLRVRRLAESLSDQAIAAVSAKSRGRYAEEQTAVCEPGERLVVQARSLVLLRAS